MLFCFVFVLVVCVVGFGIIYLILTFLVCLLRVVVFDYLLFTWLFGVVDTVAFGLVVWFDFVCGLCLVVRGIVIDGVVFVLFGFWFVGLVCFDWYFVGCFIVGIWVFVRFDCLCYVLQVVLFCVGFFNGYFVLV